MQATNQKEGFTMKNNIEQSIKRFLKAKNEGDLVSMAINLGNEYELKFFPYPHYDCYQLQKEGRTIYQIHDSERFVDVVEKNITDDEQKTMVDELSKQLNDKHLNPGHWL